MVIIGLDRLKKRRFCFNSIVLTTLLLLSIIPVGILLVQENLVINSSSNNYSNKTNLRYKTSSSEYTRITWSGSLSYGEYYVIWTNDDVDSSYEFDYFFTGDNPDIDIKATAMTNSSYDSWAFSESYSISSYVLYEGPSMTIFETFYGIDSDTPWAFVFLNEDDDEGITYLEIDCHLFSFGTGPDVEMTGKNLQLDVDSPSSSLIDQLLPFLAILGIITVIGIGTYLLRGSRGKSTPTSPSYSEPEISRSSTISSSDTSSEPNPYELSKEELDDIVKRAVSTTHSRGDIRRKNLRNGILSLAIGTFLIIGGIVSLSVGVGIYLLIAGTMFLGLGGFLLVLTRIY